MHPTFQDGTVRLWNIENAEKLPVVMENRLALGSKLLHVRFCIQSVFSPLSHSLPISVIITFWLSNLNCPNLLRLNL